MLPGPQLHAQQVRTVLAKSGYLPSSIAFHRFSRRRPYAFKKKENFPRRNTAGISVLMNKRTLLEPYIPRRGQEDQIVWVFFLFQARSGHHFPPLAGYIPKVQCIEDISTNTMSS